MDFLKYIKRINKKGGLEIAFYVDVNVFLLSNLTTLKADISKTSSERYRFLFIFICRTSKYTQMQKIKKFYREVNYVHLALSIDQNLLFRYKHIILTSNLSKLFCLFLWLLWLPLYNRYEKNKYGMC